MLFASLASREVNDRAPAGPVFIPALDVRLVNISVGPAGAKLRALQAKHWIFALLVLLRSGAERCCLDAQDEF